MQSFEHFLRRKMDIKVKNIFSQLSGRTYIIIHVYDVGIDLRAVFSLGCETFYASTECYQLSQDVNSIESIDVCIRLSLYKCKHD